MPEAHFSSDALQSLSCLSPHDRVHFIGIGGIAMGQLALATAALGYQVSGSDKDLYDPMASILRSAPIAITLGYQGGNIPADTKLAVIGNAVSPNNPEAAEIAARGIPYTTVSALTRDIVIRNASALVVCGTHGKTTTTAMISSVLCRLDYDPSYFFGGVDQANALGIHRGTGPWCILEGDEYFEAWFARVPKFSFHCARSCVITGIEHDHIDIYPDSPSYVRVFTELVLSLPTDGFALCNLDCATVATQLPSWREQASCRIITFGTHAEAEYRILSRQANGQLQHISLQLRDEPAVELTLPCIGAFNARNALAALAACHEIAEVSLQMAAEALSHFNPVLKRQQVLYDKNAIVLIVDFSYHPTAIAETLQGIRESRPDTRILAVHEPASPTSRRAIFQDAYANAFLNAAEVIICKPQAALIDRGHARLDTDILVETLSRSGIPARVLDSAEEILQYLLQNVVANDVVVFLTHANFAYLPERLTEQLAQK